MKKLINDPNAVIAEALVGIEAAHPELRVDHTNRIIYRGEPTRAGKVALISGGGSGHEPLHGGFVGPGMLDAACAGEVFTSPVPDQVQFRVDFPAWARRLPPGKRRGWVSLFYEKEAPP